MIRWIAAAFALTLTAGAARADDAAGKALYDKSCASCHGADGRGNAAKAGVLKIDAKLLDLGRDEAKAIPRDEKEKVVREGKGKMPAYGKKLAPADLVNVLDHAIALVGGAATKPAAAPPAAAPPAAAPPATAPPPAAAAGLDEAKAKPLWKKSCASCHGVDGSGNAKKAKALKIDPETLDLGRAAAAAFTRDEKLAVLAKGKGKMPGYQKKLGAAKVDLLTAYSVKLAEDLRAKHK